MFEIKIENKSQLKSFLGINKLDYVDVIVRGSLCQLVSSTNEAFALLEIPISISRNQPNLEFRVHRKILDSLDDEDTVTISATDDDVTLGVNNLHGINRYMCTFKRQVVPIVSYEDRLNEVSRLPDTALVDSEGLEGLYRIAKINGGLINVDRGVASLIMQNGIRVYKKVRTSLSFAFTSKAYEALKACSQHFRSVADLLIAVEGNFKVAVLKARLDTCSDYDLLTSNKYGSTYVAQINLGGVMQFIAKMGYKLDSITLGLGIRQCKIELLNGIFHVPFDVSGEQIANGYSASDVVLPTKIITSVLGYLGYSFMLKVKRNYVQFEFEDYLIVV